MNTKQQIDISEWQDRLESFTSGNRGRIAAIEVDGTTIVQNTPFVSVDYDPVGKGNDLIITLEGSTHTVFAPFELFLLKQSNGVASALVVVDKHKKSTKLFLV